MDTRLYIDIKRYYKKKCGAAAFIPGSTPVPVSGKVFDEHELEAGVAAVLDCWWTEGRFAREFEKTFCEYLGVRYVSLVNSGSSANLVALTALTSEYLGEKRLKPGDEVITAACGFPTTINPIIQNNLVPVFVDVDVKTKNAPIEAIKRAITPKTRAIMMAHTLGNPLPLEGIMTLVRKHALWFIEDSCDALGGMYKQKKIGTFGHISTFSFYPAHQITMGEGGAAVTNNAVLHKAIRQLRDWGRDCWCDTGRDNTCGKRFKWKLGDLPYGYDHKYIYSQIGYNLKLTDMQAAIGVAQMEKLPEFIRIRQDNFAYYLAFFSRYTKYFILPQKEKGSDPSWFGFPLVVKTDAPFVRNNIVGFLEDRKIATRTIFAGNILKHPAYNKRTDIRISGTLNNSDMIMDHAFWIGVYPGITKEMREYVVGMCEEFFKSYR